MDHTPQKKNIESKIVEKRNNVTIEQIASFDKFIITRSHLREKGTLYKEKIKHVYFLLFCLKGKIKLILEKDTKDSSRTLVLNKEETFLVSASCKHLTIVNDAKSSIYLKSVPVL